MNVAPARPVYGASPSQRSRMSGLGHPRRNSGSVLRDVTEAAGTVVVYRVSGAHPAKDRDGVTGGWF